MAAFGREGEGLRARRRVGPAIGVLLLALITAGMPDPAKQRTAALLRASLLRPFIGLQEGLAQARLRAGQVEVLMSRLDSLTGVLSTQSVLAEENRTLRSLLELSERGGPGFRPATVLRPGTPGSESMFLVDVGGRDGVIEGAPVISADGLVGVIREVRPESAVGMDWTHPDFRASAMLVDGSAFGIAENRRGTFREQDRLVLNGTAYNETVPDGTLVVTSGLGTLPRGLPIGRVDGVAEVQDGWLKSYWLRPAAQPGSATHVLVQSERTDAALLDLWETDSLRVDTTRSGGLR